MDECEDDIFDRNIDQLDVRETPRWELSEEEPLDESDVETLVNQQKKNVGQIPKHDVPNKGMQPVAPVPGNPRPNMALTDKPQSPKVHHRQGPVNMVPNSCVPQSPLLRKGPSGPKSSTSTTESVKTVMSPVLHPRHLDKKKIEELVQATYDDDDDEGDSVKDFGASQRENRSTVKVTKAPVADTMTAKIAGTTDVMSKLSPWEDDDDADSLKDYTSNDRKKEEKYMERTDEAIYQRASEEHIKRPPLWHDDEVDSLRDFGRISGKQEMPSGIASQQISRLPSDEELCLSPPWNDEDDGQVRNLPCAETEHKSYAISKMVVEERIRQAPPWHEEDADSTRDYSQFWKSRSIENSRRPSDENIYLTPPWMEEDRESCGNHSASSHMTLEEKRAIEEEARSSGINEAPAQVQALRNEQQGAGPKIPGRDSGFCSEQDQHGQQVQAASADVPEEKGIEAGFSNTQNDQPVNVTSVATTTSAPPQPSMAPIPQERAQTFITSSRTPAQDMPVIQEQEMAANTQQKLIEDLRIVPQIPTVTQHQATEDPRLIHQMYHEAIAMAPRGVRQQSLEVPRTVNKQEENMIGCIPRMGSTDTRMYNMACLSNKGIARSVSQSSLEANCYSPHDALEGLETSSVVSFASTAATHHDLDTRIDMMQSLISLLGTHDKDDMSRTLLAMSNSRDSCAAMRQSGCLPLLIDLIHGHDNPMARRDCRARAGLALHNIVYSNPEDRRGRREIRVLRLLEIVRAHCDAILYSNLPPHPCAERWYPPLRDYGPGPAVAALMKLSFEEEHRTAMCELGGLHAIAELVEIDNKVNADCYDSYSIGLRKYAGMTLTNLTFGNTKNKTILCKMEKAVKALIAQLRTPEEEELVQVSASVLRNLSWRADDVSRESLRKVGAVKALTEVVQQVQGEPALRTLLSGLWNLSAHCPENKTELCNVPGALKFIVKSLNYCSPSGNISVVESSGGILRNISSHIAVRPEYRQTLRDNGCFHTLLGNLRSPSLRVVSNACGALWNLSARCIEDQELLWELGAVSLLKSLVNSKHKAIATASSAALRNLMSVKPTSSNGTDTESISSRNARRYRSVPPASRQVEAQAKVRSSSRGIAPKGRVSPGVRSCHSSPQSQTPTVRSPKTQSPKVQSPRPQSPVVHVNQRPSQAPHHDGNKDSIIRSKHDGSVSSLDHGDQNQRIKDKKGDSSPPLSRSRSDIGPKTSRRREKTGTSAVAMDSSSVGSAASMEGRHGHLGRWSGSNDSLIRHRRNKNSSRHQKTATKQATEVTGQHSRSSSDGCAVIQLLTDTYPLQVTAKPNNAGNPSIDNFNSGVRQMSTGPSRPSGSHSDTTSVVSPATARRLNQWAEEQAIESIEMSQLYICGAEEQSGSVPNPQVTASRESMGSSTSRQRRKQSQRFRSFRDSDSEREGDIDSDDERTVFPIKRGFGNAWVNKTGSKSSPPNKGSGSQAHTTGNKHRQCSCRKVSNIWIKRGKSKAKGLCKNCMKENRESSGETADSRPAVKSRRDSSDSPLSSPNAMRGYMANTGCEDLDTDPSKRGVKVTSL